MDNEKTTYYRIINVVGLISNIVFFLVHIAYLIIFLISKAYIMVYINLGSSILYLLLFVLFFKKKYQLYVLICGFEIPTYMFVATIFCGVLSGFQLCLIGLCILAFVAGYFLKDKRLFVRPLIISILFMIAYMFLYFYSKYNSPYYILSDTINSILYISHSLIVFVFCISFMYIMTAYVYQLEKKIRKESNTDKLTQISNRKALYEYFELLGNQRSNYVIAIFDIDNFKTFNDDNGHLCGDYVLQEIAQIAKENSLDDFVSRWGGEEFVIISKIDNNIEDTIKKIDSIRNKINDFEFKYNNKTLHSTITIGVASYQNEASLDDWIKTADSKLYEGKNSGKNKTIY